MKCTCQHNALCHTPKQSRKGLKHQSSLFSGGVERHSSPLSNDAKLERSISSKIIRRSSFYKGNLEFPKEHSSPLKGSRAVEGKGSFIGSPAVSLSKFKRNFGMGTMTPLRGPIRKKASRTVLISGEALALGNSDFAKLPGIEVNEGDLNEKQSFKWEKEDDNMRFNDNQQSTPFSRKRILSENINIEENPYNRGTYPSGLKSGSMSRLPLVSNSKELVYSPGVQEKKYSPDKIAKCYPGTFDNLDSPQMPNLISKFGHSFKTGILRKQPSQVPSIKDFNPRENFLIPEDISDDSEDSKVHNTLSKEKTITLKHSQSLKQNIKEKIAFNKKMADIPEETIKPASKAVKVVSQESGGMNTETTKDLQVGDRKTLSTSHVTLLRRSNFKRGSQAK